MRKIPKFTLLASALALGIASVNVNATPIDQDLLQRVGENVIITDESGETLIKDAGNQSPTMIEVNDVLVGALDFTTMSPPQTNIQDDSELTGLFGTKIAAITDTGDQNTTSGGFTYGVLEIDMAAPGSTFWETQQAGIAALVDGTFGAGTWAAVGDSTLGFLFEDVGIATNFDRTNGTSAIADATDGLLRGIIGFRDADDYWIAEGPDDVAAFGTATLLEELGGFVFGLSFLAENFAVDFQDTVSSAPGSLGSNAYAPSFPYPVTEFFGNGDLIGRGSVPTSDDFAVYNRVDVTVNPIPAPGGIALLGLGLFALGLTGRRRRT